MTSEHAGSSKDHVATLRQEKEENDSRYRRKCEELDAQISKAKELNGRLVSAEARANEVQKKYDECKRNYFKLRDERERLRSDLEKAKGPSSGDPSTKMPANGTGEVQAQYESLKTKYRVSVTFLQLIGVKSLIDDICLKKWNSIYCMMSMIYRRFENDYGVIQCLTMICINIGR